MGKCVTAQYRMLEEYKADIQNIVHNVVIYHGAHSNMADQARQMFRDCVYDITELTTCRDCYRCHSSYINARNTFPCHAYIFPKLSMSQFLYQCAQYFPSPCLFPKLSMSILSI